MRLVRLGLMLSVVALLPTPSGHAQSAARMDQKTVKTVQCPQGQHPAPVTSGDRQSVRCVPDQPVKHPVVPTTSQTPSQPASTIPQQPANPSIPKPQQPPSSQGWLDKFHLTSFVVLLKSKWIRLLLLVLLVAILVAGIFIYRKRRAQCWPAVPSDNGIGVGAPKLYDARSLSLMLEEMQDQLQRLKNIDQQSISDAEKNVQDEAVTTTEVTIAGKVYKPVDAKAGAGDAGAGAKPNPPAPPAAEASASKPLGERPFDLLSDQVNLTYEVLNLRLILERALSDRLFHGEPRLQAVLGFPISIIPPAYAAGCCANIEVSISAENGEPPSIVALLPQERTFNATVGERRSGSVELGGALKWLNLGLQRRATSSDNSFAREPETVGTLGRSGNPAEAKFGWQLRPVAGQSSITAGMRQMFAVVALSQKDLQSEDKLSLTVKVKTNWRQFNPKTGTSSDRLSLRAWLTRRPVSGTHSWPRTLDVASTISVESSLKPYIEKIAWEPVSANRAVVTVTGRNFFPGTVVIAGDKDYRTPDDGLVIKSEKTLRLTLPLEALMYGAILDGRYGIPMRLDSVPLAKDLAQIRIDSASISKPLGAEVAQLKVSFKTVDGTAKIEWDKFAHLPDPLLQVNGQIVNTPIYFYPTKGNGATWSDLECWTLIPAQSVPDEKCSFVLRFPFMGTEWSFDYQLFLPHPQVDVTRAKAGDGKVELLIVGKPGTTFENKVTFAETDIDWKNPIIASWSVMLDKKYVISDDGDLQCPRTNLLQLKVAEDLLEKFDTLILLPPDGPAIVYSIPPKPEEIKRDDQAPVPIVPPV